jgi:hypothetical protein
VGRERGEVPEGQPPTPAYLGWDPDPVLDGWEIHREVIQALPLVQVDL